MNVHIHGAPKKSDRCASPNVLESESDVSDQETWQAT